MINKGWSLFLGIVFSCAMPAVAQVSDTSKIDSIKVDTGMLNKFRADSRKNALPVRVRPVLITPELIPVALPDYTFSYWHKLILFNLNFNQAGFTNNWSGGGVNSVALGANFDFKSEYNKAPLDYTNELNFIYGASKNKGQGFRKTNDYIYFDNKIATQLSKKWLFFGSLNFTSQFSDGYTYNDPSPPTLISRFMAPGYLTESVGLEYKPSKFFDWRLGAATAKQTFVLDTSIAHTAVGYYGVLPGHTFVNQMAFQSVATFDKDVMKNLHLNMRYTLFIPYTQSLAFVSHRVDAVLTAKVNSLVAVTINGTFLYDKTVGPQAQGTETLGLGILYKFP
ncbi:DUF3078 domain-containing protein [Mucilaginibacter sp. X5P1]|uniref:DUF3078 domain-containing protein n=1 Tax=Mucilaginibacter sp. X5P1 TaxID=2723088 RepID=UPI001615462C|nr:DUF3078 domain-containing protein [Mucilaginibacter sp. X5P1]MBB6139730.1 hypothetical protein [Mucilaginibacter sp. X5P1]